MYFIDRSGTNQSQRTSRALNPDFVKVDERTVRDLLKFARAFGSELSYFNDQNEVEGVWSRFIEAGEQFINEAIVWMDNPESVKEKEMLQKLERPHFVLFLTFLKLLEEFPQKSLNNFTQRHLDYFFKAILQFKPKPATPDKLHVIIELAKSYSHNKFELDKGTLLNAGKDKQGNPLVYKTTDGVIVNRAQVVRLSNVFVDKTVIRISDLAINTQFDMMLKLSLGENQTGTLSPGGDIPFFTFLGKPADFRPTGKFFINENGNEVLSFLTFVQKKLRTSLADFRILMQLKQNREYDLGEWLAINKELQQMAIAHGNEQDFVVSKDFIANFVKATNFHPLTGNYDSLQSVNDIYELAEELDSVSNALAEIDSSTPSYPFYIERKKDLEDFIYLQFYKESGDLNKRIGGFMRMMQMRETIRNEWNKIIEIFDDAADTNLITDRKMFLESPDWSSILLEAYNITDISDFFHSAHISISNADEYYFNYIGIEKYFGLTGEEIINLLQKVTPHELLDKAHQNKFRVKRRQQLSNMRKRGFLSMFREALGSPHQGDSLNIPKMFTSLDDVYDCLNNNTAYLENCVNFVTNSLCLTLEEFRFIIETQKQEEINGVFNVAAPEWKWERVYLFLEKAEKKKRHINTEPLPTLSSLNGIGATEDATKVIAGNPDVRFPAWKMFGAPQPNANIGFLFSSPLLLLQSGERTITLEIGVDPDSCTDEIVDDIENNLKATPSGGGNGAPAYPFTAWVTGEKDWVLVRFQMSFKRDTSTFTIDITLREDAEPVVALPVEHAEVIGNNPALKLLLTDTPAYDKYKRLAIISVNLSVKVNKLVPLIRNDNMVGKPGEPIEPFGNHPRVGSKFSFTHLELTSKKLDILSIVPEWSGLPDFESRYRNYSAPPLNKKEVFNAPLRMYDQGIVRKYYKSQTNKTENHLKLFQGISENGIEKDIYGIDFDNEMMSEKPYNSLTSPVIASNIVESNRYFFWELAHPDFGHDKYPILAKSKANELAVKIAKNTIFIKELPLYQVNPPYTPLLTSFKVNYTASIQINTETISQDIAMYHLHPFGHKQIEPINGHLLPFYGNEGELYIGLKDLEVPTDLNLLFQLAEGSAKPDVEPPEVFWDYLEGNDWKRLESVGQILMDSTNGLLNSGIFTIRIPEGASAENTLLSSGLHWLRLVTPENSRGLSDIINIHTQAVPAELVTDGVSETHFNSPLPPEAIKRLVKRKTELKTVWQPYPSYGGSPPEHESNLYKRAGERLRHKNRVLTSWDYERLVLERFPQVYLAKCIPGSALEKHKEETGTVTVIVVPNIRGLHTYDPFEPKLPVNILQDIQQYLVAHSHGDAVIHVSNPVYLSLRVRMSVELHPAYQGDVNYYLGQLHDGLLKLLAPWAYNEGAEIVLGNRFFPGVIINYAEAQFYVDYIKDFRLLYGEEDRMKVARQEQLRCGLEMPRPDGIWVSHHHHLLDATGNADRGVGYMKVGIDLIPAEIKRIHL